MKKTKFEYYDIPYGASKKETNIIIKKARSICPDAIVCMRQTSGTDFPPFMAVESPSYHEQTNNNGEFELIQVLPF